jgi:hypothetical protein
MAGRISLDFPSRARSLPIRPVPWTASDFGLLRSAPARGEAPQAFQPAFGRLRLDARALRQSPWDTRRGYDWTDRVPSIASVLKSLRVRSATLDGEVVICDPDGVSDF